MPFNLFSKLNIRRIDNLSSLQRVISFSLIVLFIVLVNWLVATNKFSNFYNAILPHDQTYTELAFNNVYNLPNTIPSNNNISFSFWIHNVEGHEYFYPYTISLISGGKTTILEKGSFSLLRNAQKSINENLSIPHSTNRQQVAVTLTNLHQSIDFWLKGTKK